MLKRFIRDESGNVESAMVLLPLLFLFLCTIQLVMAVQVRDFDQREVQNQASTRAISGSFAETDSIVKISSDNSFEYQKMLIVSKRRDIPILIPGLSKMLGGRLQSDVKGVAIIESQP